MTRYSGTKDQLSRLSSRFWERGEVEIPRQVPNDTVQWGILTKRAVKGFISLRQLMITDDGIVLLPSASQVYPTVEAVPDYPAAYSFTPDQGIFVSISLNEIGRIPLYGDHPKKSEIIPVTEVILEN